MCDRSKDHVLGNHLVSVLGSTDVDVSRDAAGMRDADTRWNAALLAALLMDAWDRVGFYRQVLGSKIAHFVSP